MTFNMLDLEPSLVKDVTKVKAREVCQAVKKVETKKSRKMKRCKREVNLRVAEQNVQVAPI